MQTTTKAALFALSVSLVFGAQVPAESFPPVGAGELKERCAAERGKFIPVDSAGGYGCILPDGRLITCCCAGEIEQCDIGKSASEDVMSKALVATLALQRQLDDLSTCPPGSPGGGPSTSMAIPHTLNSSGLTPQQCYSKDSGCTEFCGRVTGDLRYECFAICDRMLDRCLETGDWTDSGRLDPGTGEPADKRDHLAGLFLRALVLLTDADGNGSPSSAEIEAVKRKFLVESAREKQP